MINLLPYKEKKMLGRIWRLRMAIVVFVACILLEGIAGLLFFPTWLLVTNRYDFFQKQIASITSQQNFFSDADLNILDHTALTLEKKLTGTIGNDPTAYVKIIQSLTPAAVVVNKYSIGDTTNPVLQILGTAKTRNDLEGFVKELQASPSVASVDSPISNYVKNVNADFSIIVTFKKT